MQVILKPEPGNPQELYLGSLRALGVDTAANDVRFVEDNWESPVLGAWGLGWEVWLNGMEITQVGFSPLAQQGKIQICILCWGLALLSQLKPLPCGPRQHEALVHKDRFMHGNSGLHGQDTGGIVPITVTRCYEHGCKEPVSLLQFTYFQQAGGRPLPIPAVEITYGLERILMALQV